MSSNLTLYKWRVYCATDSKYEYIWLDETNSAPTTCPTNTAHTITTSLTKIYEIRSPASVEITQKAGAIGDNFKWDTVAFTATANTTTTHSFSYPFDINMLEATILSSSENTGDNMSWVVSENTTIGAITANVSVSDNVINVSSTVIDYIQVGFKANLFDGSNTEDLGYVISIDSENSTITTENASTQAFSAATPTYVRMSIYFVDNIEFGHAGRHEIGGSKIKSTFVPANTVVKCYYVNNSASDDKRIVADIELMY